MLQDCKAAASMVLWVQKDAAVSMRCDLGSAVLLLHQIRPPVSMQVERQQRIALRA